jgi:N-methylhydantoinase A
MRSQKQGGGIEIAALEQAYAAMEQEGRARLGGFTGDVSVQRAADMRYGEQVFEIAVPLDDIDWSSAGAADAIAAAFHARHRALYTYALEDQEAVLVNARLSVIGRLSPTGQEAAVGAIGSSQVGKRCVWLNEWLDVPVYGFARLADGETLAGPAIVGAETTTVLLRDGDSGRFDGRGWLEIAVAHP